MTDNSLRIKNIAIVGFLIFLAVALIYSAFWGPLKMFTDSLYKVRTINVSAEGKVEVSPNMATISFSVVSEGINPEVLSIENTNKMNAAIAFVTKEGRGVEQRDVKTTQYSLVPKYEYDEKSKKSSITGYTLTQTVLVKVRDLAKVGEILAGLPDLGINQIGDISFSVEDQEQYLAQARNEAFEKAREKAQTLASLNGVKLGDIINFSDYQPYYYGYKGEAMGLGGADGMALPPRIEPGTQEITVQVNITYALE